VTHDAAGQPDGTAKIGLTSNGTPNGLANRRQSGREQHTCLMEPPRPSRHAFWLALRFSPSTPQLHPSNPPIPQFPNPLFVLFSSPHSLSPSYPPPPSLFYLPLHPLFSLLHSSPQPLPPPSILPSLFNVLLPTRPLISLYPFFFAPPPVYQSSISPAPTIYPPPPLPPPLPMVRTCAFLGYDANWRPPLRRPVGGLGNFLCSDRAGEDLAYSPPGHSERIGSFRSKTGDGRMGPAYGRGSEAVDGSGRAAGFFVLHGTDLRFFFYFFFFFFFSLLKIRPGWPPPSEAAPGATSGRTNPSMFAPGSSKRWLLLALRRGRIRGDFRRYDWGLITWRGS